MPACTQHECKLLCDPSVQQRALRTCCCVSLSLSTRLLLMRLRLVCGSGSYRHPGSQAGVVSVCAQLRSTDDALLTCFAAGGVVVGRVGKLVASSKQQTTVCALFTLCSRIFFFQIMFLWNLVSADRSNWPPLALTCLSTRILQHNGTRWGLWAQKQNSSVGGFVPPQGGGGPSTDSHIDLCQPHRTQEHCTSIEWSVACLSAVVLFLQRRLHPPNRSTMRSAAMQPPSLRCAAECAAVSRCWLSCACCESVAARQLGSWAAGDAVPAHTTHVPRRAEMVSTVSLSGAPHHLTPCCPLPIKRTGLTQPHNEHTNTTGHVQAGC